MQNGLQVFIGISEGALAGQQSSVIKRVNVPWAGKMVQGDLVFLHPLGVGLPRCKLLFDLII